MTVKTDLSIHLIFVTKYRKPCLTEEIMSYCVDILKQECYNINIEVIAIQGDNQDHIHMMLKLKTTSFCLTCCSNSQTKI